MILNESEIRGELTAILSEMRVRKIPVKSVSDRSQSEESRDWNARRANAEIALANARYGFSGRLYS